MLSPSAVYDFVRPSHFALLHTHTLTHSHTHTLTHSHTHTLTHSHTHTLTQGPAGMLSPSAVYDFVKPSHFARPGTILTGEECSW